MLMAIIFKCSTALNSVTILLLTTICCALQALLDPTAGYQIRWSPLPLMEYILFQQGPEGGYVDYITAAGRSTQFVMPSHSVVNSFPWRGLVNSFAYIRSVALCTNVTSPI